MQGIPGWFLILAMILAATPIIIGATLTIWGAIRWRRGKRWGKGLILVPIACLAVIPIHGYGTHLSRHFVLKNMQIMPPAQSLTPGRAIAISMNGGTCFGLCKGLENTGLFTDVSYLRQGNLSWIPTDQDHIRDIATMQLFHVDVAPDYSSATWKALPRWENTNVRYVMVQGSFDQLAKLDPGVWERAGALHVRGDDGYVLYDLQGQDTLNLRHTPRVFQSATAWSDYKIMPLLIGLDSYGPVPIRRDTAPRIFDAIANEE